LEKGEWVMMGRYTQWTEKEDKIIIESFHKNMENYGARWHGSIHFRVKEDLKKKGYERSEMGVARRCFRLGLKAYNLQKREDYFKCKDCGEGYFAQPRLFNRAKSPQIYCPKCSKYHKQDWNRRHREEVLQYLRDYHQLHKKKRLGQQKTRRANNRNTNI
jgi:hypothetical protein